MRTQLRSRLAGLSLALLLAPVAALADPYTGFQIALRPIDDSTCTPSGDCQVGDLEYETYGGTSLASPITAAGTPAVSARARTSASRALGTARR